MRKLAFFLCCCVLALSPTLSTAQTAYLKGEASVPPPVILTGLLAYKNKGPENGPQEAVQAWTKNSTINGSQESLRQANILQQTQSVYGTYRTFDVIAAQELTPRIHVFYLALNYDRGPLYGRFVVYRTLDYGWIVMSFSFQDSDTAILPASLE